MEKIDGAAIAERIKDEVAKKIHNLKEPRPNLAIILLGDRPDSRLYVSLKEREGKKVGIDTHLYKIEAGIEESEVIKIIDFLNRDETIDGILVQLPLPSGYNTDKVIAAIDPLKDVDGFHPAHPGHIVSPVLASVSACLEEIKFSAQGKSACVLYNSEIFGKSLKELLVAQGLKIVPRERSAEADLLISALGEPGVVRGKDIKSGVVIIDIGISLRDGRVCGDLNWSEAEDKADWATPVPGGIGPLTIAFLFKNVWEIFYRRRNKKNER